MESIRLVVKTPNQRFKDIHIECDLGWTVKKLKEYLANVHPTNPETLSQKLIYSGHLLNDEQQLKEVLNKEHNSHTLHIVCPSASEENAKDKQSKSKPEKTECHSASTNIPSSEGVRHRNTSQGTQQTDQPNYGQWNSYNDQYAAYWQNYYENLRRTYYSSSQTQNQAFAGTAAANNLYQWQLNMIGTMYRQSMPGIHPHFNAGTVQPSPVTTPSTPSTPNIEPVQQGPDLDNQPAAAQPEANLQGQREQAVNNEQMNANMPMNAGGAMFDEDDENGDGRRDWLDWVHTFMRASVMISIMYFYSSTIRILMISLLGFIIYLYQAGWLNWRRHQNVQDENLQRNQNGNQVNGQQEDEEQNGDSHERDEAENGTDEHDSNSIQQNVQPPAISPFRAQLHSAYMFVTTFFTSLIEQ